MANTEPAKIHPMAKVDEGAEIGDGTRAMATVHPSWLLRLRRDEERTQAYAGFVRDLGSLKDPSAAGATRR